MKRKILSLALTICMVLSLLPTVALADVGSAGTPIVIDMATVNSNGEGYTHVDNVITITEDGYYKITGTTTTKCVAVAGNVTADIMLENASIIMPLCPLELKNGATVNLILSGTNVLKSSDYRPGLQAQADTKLTISALNDDVVHSLTAAGSDGSAGIGFRSGGVPVGNHGTITINSGTVNATGNGEAAGIGGGGRYAGDYYSGESSHITINGGVVIATGGTGIDGGYGNNGGKTTITGGTVIATSTGGGAGIGGGSCSKEYDVIISGGAVTAICNYNAAGCGGAGIGSGYDGTGGTVTILGGTVIATGGAGTGTNGGGAGIGSGGGNSSGVTINISGGSIFAIGRNGGQGIGQGAGGAEGTTEITVSGENPPVIITNSITPTTQLTGSDGVAANATVSGTTFTLAEGLTIPANAELTIPAAVSLVVPNGVSLTNNGRIDSYSNLSVAGSGKIFNSVYVNDAITHNIHFDLNGGTGTANSIHFVENGDAISLPTPTLAGHRLTGWFTSVSGGTEVTGATSIENSMMLYARWIKQHTVTYDANGVSSTDLPAAATVDVGGIVTVSAAPTAVGYYFMGWNKNGDGSGDTVSGDLQLNEDMTLYAQWVPAFDVTLDENYAGAPTNIAKTGANRKLATLPTPTRSGYTFVGWFNLSDGGDPVTTETEYNAATTIFAQWKKNASSDGTYTGNTPTLPKEPTIDGGKGWEDITDKVQDAKDGEKITIDMGGTTEVPGDFLDALSGKDINVTFDMGNGMSWAVNGRDVPASSGALNLGVALGGTTIPASVTNIDGSIGTVQLSLSHDGAFPFQLTFSVKLDKVNAGYFANLYFYNETTKALEFRQAVTVGADGKTEFVFDHASEYAIVVDDISHVPWNNPFTDVKEGDWFYSDVEFVHKNSLFNGTSDTTFSPKMSMTRGMVVTVLGRLAGVDIDDYSGESFDDVDTAQYYAPYVKWAAEMGIVNGVGDNKFAPDTNISRQDLVVIINNYAEKMNMTMKQALQNVVFVDLDDIASYAIDAVGNMVHAGVINGNPDGTFAPKANATRAEVAAMLHRFVDAVQ